MPIVRSDADVRPVRVLIRFVRQQSRGLRPIARIVCEANLSIYQLDC